MLDDTLLQALRVVNALNEATDRVREVLWTWRTAANFVAHILMLRAREALGLWAGGWL